jgi:hypothetical protein
MSENVNKKSSNEKKDIETNNLEIQDILTDEEKYAEILKQLKILTSTEKEVLRILIDKFEPKLPL